MIILLLLLFHLTRATVIDVFAKEQYVAVMRAEEYVQPDGSPNTAPSIFIGLIHMAVTPNNDGTYTITTTVWHDVAKATIIYITGPAVPGGLPPSPVPLLTLVSGGAADSTNCPLYGSYIVTASFIQMLRTNMLFAEIDSSATPELGNVRGQIYQRDDSAVAFITPNPTASTQYSADQGMAIIHANEISGNPNFFYLDFWILSQYPSGTFVATLAGANPNNVAIFGDVSINQTTPITLVISQPGLGPVAPRRTVFTGSPLVGPGSTNLQLVLQQIQLNTRFSLFFRVVKLSDFAVLANNGTAPVVNPGFNSYGIIGVTLGASLLVIALVVMAWIR